eukprot:TRINITY_DN10135_c0_g1_i3.p1 TRINITY_DN10135_c0_g1~~TRINITY_DN10135_c0_g1_i3.p1  ORF type:complete len:177 (+),score=35.17 TRINITY_DN10135_c0_g1_i3:67-597(+)
MCIRDREYDESKEKRTEKEMVDELYEFDQQEQEKPSPEPRTNNVGAFQPIAGTIYFTEIPLRKVLSGKPGEELTKANLDKSELLTELLTNNFSGKHEALFGEFQFAFVAFLLGENYDGFTQWKKIFALVTQCEALVSAKAQILIDLVRNFPFKMMSVDHFYSSFTWTIETISCRFL